MNYSPVASAKAGLKLAAKAAVTAAITTAAVVFVFSAAALGALATAAAATPSTPPPLDGAMTGMASMHATQTTQVHTNTEGMTAMHAAMSG